MVISDRAAIGGGQSKRLRRLLPFLAWFDRYPPAYVKRDLVAGVTVALVLIPQSMAYAQLANLPAYYGLYAAFLPPVVAVLFGSSYQLATGPVAVVSLMTATALSPLASAGSDAFVAYALMLAFTVGLFQLALGVFKLGLVVNFLSHPVVNGFTNAAALIIASTQLASLLGVRVEAEAPTYQTVVRVFEAAYHGVNWPTLGMGVLAFTVMVFVRRLNPRYPYVLVAVVITTAISYTSGYSLRRTVPLSDIPSEETVSEVLEHNRLLAAIDSILTHKVTLNRQLKDAERDHGPHSTEVIRLHYEIALADLEINHLREADRQVRTKLAEQVWVADDRGVLTRPSGDTAGGVSGRKWRISGLSRPINPEAVALVSGGAVVGAIPKGLPHLKVPDLNPAAMADLFIMAVVISVLGFMEAISIAKAIAARTGQRIDPNQELIGQGLANLSAAFFQGYPVSGSFSRSAVNLAAGAVTGMSSVFSSLGVGVVLLVFTPLLYYLPQSALAAIIMMAVVSLLNVRGFVHAWQAQRFDGIISIVSFITTLVFAPHLDRGILLGVVLSLGVYLIRKIKPEVALLSRYWDGTYRNAERRGLQICRHIAVVRFNDSLFFANVNFLENKILEIRNSMPELRHVHIVGNAINELDASGEETLARIIRDLRGSGLDVTFSGLNEEVLDVLRRTHLYEVIGEDHIFGNVALAVLAVYKKTHLNSPEERCPLIEVRAVGLPVDPELAAKLSAQDQQLRQWNPHAEPGEAKYDEE